MDFGTTPIPISFSVDNTAASPKYSQLWEVVLVAASPVMLVFCLCFCIVCLVFRKQEPAQEATVERSTTSNTQATSRRNAIVNLLRNLPPPPKYEIAISTSSVPPLYHPDVEKNIIFDPIAAIQSSRRTAAHQRNGEACSLSIQYLYPPKYETQSQPASRSTPPSPPAYSLDTVNEEDEELPTYSDATSSTISTPLSSSPIPV